MKVNDMESVLWSSPQVIGPADVCSTKTWKLHANAGNVPIDASPNTKDDDIPDEIR